MKQFIISAREAGQRMDKYVCKVLGQAPRGFIYKMLRKKNIVLNEKKATGAEILQAQDVVKMYLADETFAKFATAAKDDDAPLCRMSLQKGDADGNAGNVSACLSFEDRIAIVYEDEDILVINKPAGMLSQKARPKDISANEYIIAYLIRSGQLTQNELHTFRPSICNRLDRNTSGLLVAGKTMRGLQDMARLFKTHAVKKFYRALVVGTLTEPQRLDGYLTKDYRMNQVRVHADSAEEADVLSGKAAVSGKRKGDYIETAYVPVARVGAGTLLEVQLITGRSHQIRAHLASIGHPVLGDPKYGDRTINRRLSKETGICRQLLHACRMEFPDGKIITADVPEDFTVAARWLKSFER